MPIRNVVTRGYGNGTFSPGVSFVATRGYSIAEAVVTKSGPAVVAALAAYGISPPAMSAISIGPAALSAYHSPATPALAGI